MLFVLGISKLKDATKIWYGKTKIIKIWYNLQNNLSYKLSIDYRPKLK